MELVSNRRAFHDYEILETFEAGIVLFGSEIKSLRDHGGSLQDAYVDVKGSEIWLINSSIAPYSHAGIYNHEDRRIRKLLMHKKEIEQIRRLRDQKKLNMIPLSIYLNKKGIAKVRFGAGKGKKAYDKRAALKEKAEDREMRRGLDD